MTVRQASGERLIVERTREEVGLMWEKHRWSLWEIGSGSEDLLCVDLKDLLPSFLGQICLEFFFWKKLDLQHQYNNGTIIPHMRVGPTY